MKPITSKVFRAYDIRGIVDVDFDEEWVETLGKALGTYFQQRNQRSAVIGHDCRHSSPAYQQALAKGMLSTGLDVVLLGMVPTPVLYFAVKHLNKGAGVVITASHNPPEYNGFKIWCGETTIHTTEVDAVYEIMAAGSFAEGRGIGCYHDVVPSYLDAICERVQVNKPLKVILDGGNGSGGEVCQTLLERLGCDVIPMYCEPDGDFPNHHPDPTIEKYMRDLQQKVIAEKADVGIGLDGDADRLGAVDATGRLLLGDELFCLFARDALVASPGGLILGDVKCSHRLFRDIEEHGGEAAMWITGHSVMKAKMLKEDAAMAGELSGHMFFNHGWYGFDDALFAAAKLMRILAESPVPLTELPGWEKTCSTPEVHVACADEHKFEVIKKAQAYFRNKFDVNEIDGVRISFSDGWALMRASNTQPVLVLRFEAETEERLAEIRQVIEQPLAQWIEEIS